MALCCGLAPRAGASATLLLEEPYGKLGFFTATGHAAVYLSGVCAETPLTLRRCEPGEIGAVISRYDGVSGYDWVAIPLVPYLYSVDDVSDIPLFADAKTVAFLRDHYRRAHLEEVAPDRRNGDAPRGNWYELIGSSYDRTIYGFEIETTSEQDEALIRKYNSMRNHSRFHTASSNCADFARDLINFYYPHALHRSFVSDLGITTPKQIAKTLVKFGQRHSELQFARLVIPQVPGSVPRSTAVHGVVESFFKAKKYIVPSAVVSPLFAGCVAAVYIGGGSGRFDPGHDALILTSDGRLEPPLKREDRRAYSLQLDHLLAAQGITASGRNFEKSWGHLQAKSNTEIDENGRPVLQMHVGQETVNLGIAADNLFGNSASPQLVQQLLEARLHDELHHTRGAWLSESEIARDWNLLERAIASADNESNSLFLNRLTNASIAHSFQTPAVSYALARASNSRRNRQ